MGSIEKRGRQVPGQVPRPSRSADGPRPSTCKADAERFLRRWRSTSSGAPGSTPSAEMPLADWAEEFLALARRLSPTTQETYRRDLDKYVLPRFGSYRIGRLPADEIENWLNDEVGRGHRSPAPSTGTTGPCGGCSRWPSRSRRSWPTRAIGSQPPRVPETGDECSCRGLKRSTWPRRTPERYRALIYLAVD